MNETEIRQRLRDAVGEAHYPSALKSRVEARLREPAPTSHPRLLALVAAALAVVIVGSLVFIRLQSVGFLPAERPATAPSSATSPAPEGTPQTIGQLPVADLAAGGLTAAASYVSVPNLAQTSAGRTVRLVGAYADTARVVVMLRTLPEAFAGTAQLSDDNGLINAGAGGGTGVVGDEVIQFMQGPHAGADGIAHLKLALSNLQQGPPFTPSVVGAPNPGAWNFSFSLKVQPAIPLSLSPKLTSVGSWRVTVEKFEATPSVIHMRAVVDGPSPIDVHSEAFVVLDGNGKPLNGAGGSSVAIGAKSTRVDEAWVRAAGEEVYQLVVSAGGTYTSDKVVIAEPPSPSGAKGAKGKPLTPLDFPSAAEALIFSDSMNDHITTGRPQSCGGGSGGSGSLFQFATYFQHQEVWYYVSFTTDPSVQQYRGPGTYTAKASLAPVSPLGPADPTFTGTAHLTVTSDSGLHEGNLQGTLHWADDPNQTVGVSGKWTCMPGTELGPA